MKKKFRLIAVIFIVLVLLSSLSIYSTFASHSTTGNYYMNGYKMNGHLWGYSNYVDASTYCENISYGKRVAAVYQCYVGLERVYFTTDTDTYVVHGFDTVSISANYPEDVDLIAYVRGYHWVKASEHMIWSSEASGVTTQVPIN